MNLHPQLKNPKFYLLLFGDVVIFVLDHIAAYLFFWTPSSFCTDENDRETLVRLAQYVAH